MIEKDICRLVCDCSLIIEWEDWYEPGFKTNDYGIMQCGGCDKEHKLKIRGSLHDLKGAKTIRWLF